MRIFYVAFFFKLVSLFKCEDAEIEIFIDLESSDTQKIELNESMPNLNKDETLKLTNTHSIQFNHWLDKKSNELFEMSRNFSGFEVLNRTYASNLAENKVEFKWINFTAMIMNISRKIGEVLSNRTSVVENLSDLVERAYHSYQRDNEKIKESVSHVYYDSKSKKTFCDVAENSKSLLKNTGKNVKNGHFTPKIKKALNVSKNGFYYVVNLNMTQISLNQSSSNQKVRTNSSLTKSKVKTTKLTTTTKTTTATTTTTTELFSFLLDDYELEAELELDNLLYESEDGFDDLFWDVECVNRTLDENFRSAQVQKVNRNMSTIQTPINIFKQDLAVNMTAYWTQALDEQFRANYERDNELFWQYFCSSLGLFRRYPGAHWTIKPKDDFFDCRLQSWYMMAAASPKDALIMLDVSGSMTGLRLEIGKKLIEFILDTFTDNDFFNIITYSNTPQFLLYDEPEYAENFVQASKANRLRFKERLRKFNNTSQMAMLHEPLKKAFDLFNDESLVRSGCNKMLMIITDAQSDNVDRVFAEYNGDKRVRVFSFKIGRDMTDLIEIRKLACDNNGEYYHVVTLTDINEHVYQYISVLSRPMALLGVHETTWSNVFIGYLDKELKIAVARPAFANLNKHRSEVNEGDDILKKAYGLIKSQQMLLGVVGLDVPVLRLISKVSPKFQMGVGIYIIMLDNNGFIVYHPSIKQEIALSVHDFKGTSQSIELNKFEIPIENERDFESLEHEMIDQVTSARVLDNWKRDGLRVIKRQTEYVYTPVANTPFSVAIASPKSFGRFYIQLDPALNYELNEILKNVDKKKVYESLIQVYNCTYTLNKLSERLVAWSQKAQSDYCIRYLSQDDDQILAVKSDLVLHDIFYHAFNPTNVLDLNSIVSSFYGSYSGLTFYMPAAFFKARSPATFSDSSLYKTSEETQSSEQAKLTEETDSTTVNKLNLFSSESNKYTFSFEKPYYTRSFELSDFLRTEFDWSAPIVNYFLNNNEEGRHDTVSGTVPIWLDKVPILIAGVVFHTKFLNEHFFNSTSHCDNNNNNKNNTCYNICNRRPHLNLTCYLIDENGIIVLTSAESKTSVLNKPLYEVNPWLMFKLELDGFFNLIIPGRNLQDCTRPPLKLNNAAFLKNFFGFVLKTLFAAVFNLVQFFFSYIDVVRASSYEQRINLARQKFESDWRVRNSHCSYFGVYHFNFTKWKEVNASQLRLWCNSRGFMLGYVNRSNLLMLVVEDEAEASKCGSMDFLIQKRTKNQKEEVNDQINKTVFKNRTLKSNYSVNRYRKAVSLCYDFYPNESTIFTCRNSFNNFFKFNFMNKNVCLFILIYSTFIKYVNKVLF